MKELVKAVTVLPSASENPLTETVYTLFVTKVALGTKVRVIPSLARLNVPATALPFDGVSVIELLVSVVGSMVLLITAMISALSGVNVWPFEGAD